MPYTATVEKTYTDGSTTTESVGGTYTIQTVKKHEKLKI